MILLNLIRIIYSHIVVNSYNIILDSDIIEKIIETHNTSNLTDYEICMWIDYLKRCQQCENWNKYQMFREVLYHKNLYKHQLFMSHTDYTDFEKTQTIKTYILRFIGNCVY